MPVKCELNDTKNKQPKLVTDNKLLGAWEYLQGVYNKAELPPRGAVNARRQQMSGPLKLKYVFANHDGMVVEVEVTEQQTGVQLKQALLDDLWPESMCHLDSLVALLICVLFDRAGKSRNH